MEPTESKLKYKHCQITEICVSSMHPFVNRLYLVYYTVGSITFLDSIELQQWRRFVMNMINLPIETFLVLMHKWAWFIAATLK